MNEFPKSFMTKVQFTHKIQTDIMPMGDASRFCDYLFSVFDTDNDGHINFDEFVIENFFNLEINLLSLCIFHETV